MSRLCTFVIVCLTASTLAGQAVPISDPNGSNLDPSALDFSSFAPPIDPALISTVGERASMGRAPLEGILARKGVRSVPPVVGFGPPCTIPACTGTDENEPCGDDTNNGCVDDFCDPAACIDAGAGGTWCGTSWADGGLRDLDYYSITVGAGTVLNATLNSGFSSNLILIESLGGAANCDGLLVTVVEEGGGCAPVSISRTLQAGTYYVVVTTGDSTGPIFDGIPCVPSPSSNDYQLDIALTSSDCLTCTGTPEAEACGLATNEGCNAAAPAPGTFETIPAATTICGSVRTFIDAAGAQARDTDWYDISALAAGAGSFDITVEFTSEFPGTAFILQDTGGAVASCGTLLLAGDEVLSGSCSTSTGVFTVNGGGTYYLFVSSGDEFGPIFDGIGDCSDPANNYELTVSSAPATCPTNCPLTCVGTPEGEACPLNPFDPDNFNGGCNATITPLSFSPISIGDTVCGTTWADSGTRDTDWYRFDATTPDTLTVDIVSQVPVDVFLISDEGNVTALDPGGCNLGVVTVNGVGSHPGDCSTQTFTANINPNATIGFSSYALFIAPANAAGPVFAGFPCVCDFGYELTLSGSGGATCQFPTGICDSDCSTGDLVFPLQAPVGVAYDDVLIEVFDLDGNPVASANSGPVGAGQAFTMVVTPPGDGVYNVTLTATCPGGATDEAVCTTFVYELVPGTTDIVFDGDPGGCIDSGQALVDALQANGRTVTLVDNLFQAIDTYDCIDPDVNLWVALGSFPNNVPMLPGEGTFLQLAVLAGTNNVYVEGGDVWGFDAPTAFFDVDGVEGLEADGTLAADGDDSFAAMNGAAGTLIDTSGFTAPVTYNQDNLNPAFAGGLEFTDQLNVTLGSDLPAGTIAEAIWTNSDAANPYVTAIAKAGPDDSTSSVIVHSYEFGGFGDDQNGLMALYLGHFSAGAENCTNGVDDDGDSLVDCDDPDCAGTPTCPTFSRGDCNQDGGFNIADPIFHLGALFPTGPPNVPQCDDACDSNDDGSLNIADPIAMLAVLFPTTSPPPILPAPTFPTCGADPTSDPLDCGNAAFCP